MNTKICIKCHQEKPIIEFYKAKNNKYGLNNKCKNCCQQYLKKYYSINSKNIIQNSKLQYLTNPEKKKQKK